MVKTWGNPKPRGEERLGAGDMLSAMDGKKGAKRPTETGNEARFLLGKSKGTPHENYNLKGETPPGASQRKKENSPPRPSFKIHGGEARAHRVTIIASKDEGKGKIQEREPNTREEDSRFSPTQGGKKSLVRSRVRGLIACKFSCECVGFLLLLHHGVGYKKESSSFFLDLR